MKTSHDGGTGREGKERDMKGEKIGQDTVGAQRGGAEQGGEGEGDTRKRKERHSCVETKEKPRRSKRLAGADVDAPAHVSGGGRHVSEAGEGRTRDDRGERCRTRAAHRTRARHKEAQRKGMPAAQRKGGDRAGAGRAGEETDECAETEKKARQEKARDARQRTKIRGCLLLEVGGTGTQHEGGEQEGAAHATTAEAQGKIWRSALGRVASEKGEHAHLRDVRTTAECDEAATYRRVRAHGGPECESACDQSLRSMQSETSSKISKITQYTPSENMVGQGSRMEEAIEMATVNRYQYMTQSRWHEQQLIIMLDKLGSESLRWRYGDG